MKKELLLLILIVSCVSSCTKENDSSPHLKINDISIDNQDTKWFATESGLSSLNSAGVWTNYSSTDQKIASSTILSVKVETISTKNSELWVGTNNGLTVMAYSAVDAVTGATCYTSANSGLLSTTINSIFIGGENVRWYGTDNGVAIFGTGFGADKVKWLNASTKYLTTLKNQKVTSITSYGDTSFFIGTKGIRKTADPSEKPNNMFHITYNDVDGVTGASTLNWNGTYEDTVFCAFVDKNSVRWTGTNKGLLRHATTDLKSFDKFTKEVNPALPENHVYCIAQDSKGIIWIGTGKGLAWFDGTSWNATSVNVKVNAIAFDKAGNAWLATDNGYILLK